MRTALYYPHTEVQSESLVRTALLTWDSLETVAPFDGYQPYYANREIAEAMEIIGRVRSPSEEDKLKVHDLLEDMIGKGVPATFHYETLGQNYELWPQKLMPQTWDLLASNNVIGPLLANADYPTTPAAGLTIMAMLADVMAGETRARVTDRAVAYATIANAPEVMDQEDHAADEIDEIVPLTFKSLSLENVGLKRLIDFRKREAGPSGHQYRALRHQYLDAVEVHLKEASQYAPGSADRAECDRIFLSRLEDDLSDLKDELGVARRDALLSKDTITFILAAGALAAGAVAAATIGAPLVIPVAMTLTGAPASIGGVLSVTNKYAAERQKVLRSHPMAYLYEIEDWRGR